MDTSNRIKEDVKSQFGQNANEYLKSKLHAQGKDLAKLLETANLTKNDIVLDVATGGGHVANTLAPLVQKVIAFDLTTEILEVAKKFIQKNGYMNVDFVQGDAEAIAFPDGFFDIVTCRLAAHHFGNANSFLSEVARVLRPGGQFLLLDNVSPEEDIFDDFYNFVEKRRDFSHFRAWKKSEWIQMLEKQDFEINEFYRFPKTFTFKDWCERMKVSNDDKQELTSFMLDTSLRIKNKFRIREDKGQVLSFQGESILLKAAKCKF